jgi:hypothetical protein
MSIRLDGQRFTLVGVARESFVGIKVGTPRDVWVPIVTVRRLDPDAAARFTQRRASWLEMFGRLEPGVTLEQARAQFSGIARPAKSRSRSFCLSRRVFASARCAMLRRSTRATGPTSS